MLYFIIFVLIIAVIIGGYYTFCYMSILSAFKQIIEELSEIQQDLTQNQMLHLPIPNRHLGELLSSFNITLEEIRKERQKYEKREKEFQKQIENISHDLRTPLTVILGYLKFMKKSESIPIADYKELSDTIDIMEGKAENMKNLVTQFYDYSRLNAGDFQLNLSSVDIARALRESIMSNYPMLEQSHLQIEIEIPDYPIWVLGEGLALERIFLNLMQNAGRYADTYLHISIQKEPEKCSVLFINDTKLLTEEDIPHLYERFYMQDSSRNQGGTGLGLTVAKSLAEEMKAVLRTYVVNQEPAREPSQTVQICFELCMKAL